MNENLRDILPYFRPRSAELTPFVMSVLVLLCIGIVGLFTFHYIRIHRQRRQMQERFEQLALEKGLADEQIQFLLKIVRQSHMNNPLLLLNSVHVFDRQVGVYTERLAKRDPATSMLDDIGQIRTALEFDHLPPDQPLRTTRQLQPGLTLMVWARKTEEEGSTPWLVVERDERAIEVVPLLKEDTSLSGLKPGDGLTMRFWREGDTEYHFDTDILEIEPVSRTVSICHASRIERLELRDFFRLEANFDITLLAYPRVEEVTGEEGEATAEEGLLEEEGESIEEEFDPDQAPRILAEVLNLSAGGLSVLIHNALPPTSKVMVTPDFKGPFPLAGVTCQITRETQEPEGTHLQLKFVDLPPTLESELVRTIYQHQILSQNDGETELSVPPRDRDAKPDSEARE